MAEPKLPIWAILSDWGMVVVKFDNHHVAAVLEAHTYFTAKWIHRLLFVDHWDRWEVYMQGQVSTTDFMGETKRRLQLRCEDEVLLAALASGVTPNQPVIDLWREVRTHSRTRLVAASNLGEIHHRNMAEMGIHDLFDGHCLSYVERVIKPDRRFFLRALSIAGTEPHETLFVDDHPDFCAAARRLGIHAELYDIAQHEDFMRRIRERYLFVA